MMGDTLQEVVGEPLSEERKQELMMQFGHHMPDNMEAAGATPVISEQQHEQSSTSASSGSRPDLVRKTITKPRELQRRVSGGDKPPMRDLLGDFMEADKTGDGKELCTEEAEEQRAATAQAQVQGRVPAQAGDAGHQDEQDGGRLRRSLQRDRGASRHEDHRGERDEEGGERGDDQPH